MCAIHGILWPSERQMDEMLCQAHHRGPDGNGKWHNDQITLGHNLLSIVDTVENSKQPWFYKDWVLVYNGEIYNYKELNDSLKHQFQTDTDTETLIVGLDQKGKDFINELDGMFAFAAYNKKTQNLIIARDSNGTKPLYYGYIQGKLAFSSEIKSLLEIGFPRKVDKEGFRQYYKQGYNAGYLTLIKSIKKLVPGEVVEINVITDKKVSTNINNIPIKIDNSIKSPGDVSDMVRVKLNQAVKQTLMGRRKIGLFLSGGIDSSSILYEMTQHLKTKPNTFSSSFLTYFRGSRLNEDAKLAAYLSDLYGGNHQEIRFPEQDYVNEFENTMEALEEPRQAKSLPVYYSTNKMISENDITVTLSGDGGDELLCGYKHHRLGVNLPAEQFPWHTKLKGLCANHRILNNKELWATHKDQIEYLDSWLPKGGLQGDKLNDLMYIECLNTLAEDFLIRNDKLGMRFSMEGRFPFMNRTFRDFVRSIPGRVKVNKKFLEENWAFHNKPLLKTAYYKRLPKQILERDKTGWRFPTDEGIIGKMTQPAPDSTPLKEYFRSLMKNKDIQNIFEYTTSEIDDKYMLNKNWKVDVNEKGDPVVHPNAGQKSQKELFTIATFAAWYKVFKMNI